MIGAKPEAIHKGEDRFAFKELMLSIGLDVPISGVAHNMDEAREVARKIGKFPLIIRPAFTLGGTGGGIGYNQEEFEAIAKSNIELSPVNEILIEESLLGWKEYEMEVENTATRPTTVSSSAPSRTSTTWASAPATPSPWRASRR